MKQYFAVLISTLAICVLGDGGDPYGGMDGKKQSAVTTGMFVLLPYHSNELTKLSMTPLHEMQERSTEFDRRKRTFCTIDLNCFSAEKRSIRKLPRGSWCCTGDLDCVSPDVCVEEGTSGMLRHLARSQPPADVKMSYLAREERKERDAMEYFHV